MKQSKYEYWHKTQLLQASVITCVCKEPWMKSNIEAFFCGLFIDSKNVTRECDANPNEFKCVCRCQNITAFDLKTALFRSLITGRNRRQPLFSFMITSQCNAGEYWEYCLQERNEVLCHLKTSQKHNIDIHDVPAFSFRRFFPVRKALLGIKRMLITKAKALNYFCMK